MCGVQVLPDHKDKEMPLRYWELKAEPHKRFGNLGNIQNIHAGICQDCKIKLSEQLSKQHVLREGNRC